MNVEAMAVAAAKRKIAEAQAELDKWNAVLVAFGGKATVKGKPGPKAGKGRGKPTAAIQAMADKRAVEAGTATAEQMKRYVARVEAKGAPGKAPAKPNGPIAQGRAKRAAAGTASAPAASLEPESEA